MSDSIAFKIAKIINSYHKYFNSIQVTSSTIFMLEYENDNPNFKHKVSFHKGIQSVIKSLHSMLIKNDLKIKEINIQNGLFIAPISLNSSFYPRQMNIIRYINHYPIFIYIRYGIGKSILKQISISPRYGINNSNSNSDSDTDVYAKFCKQNKNTAYYENNYYYPFTTLDNLRKEMKIAEMMLA